MRNANIQLCYCSEGKEFEFDLDTGNSNDRRRILATIEWAARNQVELYIIPIRVEEKQSKSAVA
jgi:hypothetical protein